MTKMCNQCKQLKTLDEFSFHTKSKRQLQTYCKICRAKLEKERRKDPLYKARIKAHKQKPENRRRTKDLALRRLFGISINDYEIMYSLQNGLCGICFKKEKISHIRNLAVDHCHETSKVRGLLCTSCNQGIGHLKDSVELLENAIKYLKGESK